MTFVGCDLHTRTQQVAVLDTGTGEVSEHQLAHEGNAVEEFYAALPRPVTVGIESTGSCSCGCSLCCVTKLIMTSSSDGAVQLPSRRKEVAD